jgi:hypothetical protein
MARKPKTQGPLKFKSGLSEQSVEKFIAEAKHLDFRTMRYDRWTADLESKIKAALVPCRDVPEMKATLNGIVVSEIGGGYFGRGPFAL